MATKVKKQKLEEVSVNKMGIGSYRFGCPTSRELVILQNKPKNGEEIYCKSCKKNHIVNLGRTKHFSHYL